MINAINTVINAPITLSQRKLTQSLLNAINTIISDIIAAMKIAFSFIDLLNMAIRKIPKIVP